MPNLSWKQIGDLKHVLVEASGKLHNDGLDKEAKYIMGVIDIIEKLTNDHEKEDK